MNILPILSGCFITGALAALNSSFLIFSTGIFLCFFLLINKTKNNYYCLLSLLFYLSGCFLALSSHIANEKKYEALLAFNDLNGTFTCRCENFSRPLDNKYRNIDITVLQIKSFDSKTIRTTPFKAILYTKSDKEIKAGALFQINGFCEQIHSSKNPGLQSFEETMAQKGIFFRIKSNENLFISGHTASFKYLVLNYKEKIIENIAFLHPQDNLALINGITFGDRALFSQEMTELFMYTGTQHLTAASGLNLTIITSIIILGFKKIKINPVITSIIAALVSITYIFAAGCSGSIIRAGAMGIIGAFASSAKKEYDIINALSLSALIICAANPNILHDLGFQLSCAAVAGITCYSSKPDKKNKTITGYLSESFFAAFSAEAAVIPLVISNFCRWIPLSPFHNIITAPLCFFILYTSVIECFFYRILPILRVIGYLNNILCSITLATLRFLLDFSVPPINICPLPSIFSVIYYLVGIALLMKYKGKKAVPFAMIAVFIGSCLLYPCLTNILTYKESKLTFLDVGNGDSCIIKTSTGKIIAIDFGASGKFFSKDCGESIILPFLLKSGINKIDIAIITHNDDDHCGGFEKLNKRIKIKTVIKNTDIIKYHLPAEIVFSENEKLIILSPAYLSKDDNNDSITAIFESFGKKILFCGDIGSAKEKELILQFPNLKADILKVSHHGSSTASCETFLSSIKPKVAVISVGRNNKFGHPAPEVTERLKNINTRSYRTDYCGALTVKINKEKIHINTEK